jgi:hypothetical protein
MSLDSNMSTEEEGGSQHRPGGGIWQDSHGDLITAGRSPLVPSPPGLAISRVTDVHITLITVHSEHIGLAIGPDHGSDVDSGTA